MLDSLWASQTGASVMSSVDLATHRGQLTVQILLEPWLVFPCVATTQVRHSDINHDCPFRWRTVAVLLVSWVS